MGAHYAVSGQIDLDISREAEYLPILEQMRDDLLPEEYSYDPATGNFWIDSWTYRSHASMERIDNALAQLGRYAAQGVRLDTRYDGGDVEPLWIGPDKLAIVRAKIAEMEQHLASMNEQLAALKEEEQWLQQSAAL